MELVQSEFRVAVVVYREGTVAQQWHVSGRKTLHWGKSVKVGKQHIYSGALEMIVTMNNLLCKYATAFLLHPVRTCPHLKSWLINQKMNGLAKLGTNLFNVTKDTKGKILCYFTILALFPLDWPFQYKDIFSAKDFEHA